MSQEHRQGPSVSQLDSKFIQFLKNPSPSLDLRFSLFLQTKSSRHNLSLGSWDVHTSEVYELCFVSLFLFIHCDNRQMI